jgi:hypothetical protein
LIRLVIGFIANLAILETIGIITLVIDVVWDRWDARLAVGLVGGGGGGGVRT